MTFENIPEFMMTFNFFVLVVNILILIFARKIVHFLDTSDLEGHEREQNYEENNKKKVKFLHMINIVIFITYPITFYIQIAFLNDLITVLFIVLLCFIVNSILLRKIIMFYGQEIEINEQKYWKKGYKTNVFSLLTTLFMFLLGVLLCLQALHLDDLFETGGVIAGILAFVGFTAPVWAPDMVAAITLLHNNRIQVGNVIQIKELNLLAWVRNISLTEVKLIDLVYGHPIFFRPSKFRNMEVENLSVGVGGRKIDPIQMMTIKVDYKHTLEEVEAVCLGAFDEMIADIEGKYERKFFPENPYRDLEIDEFGDNATHYKFTYKLSTPFYIPKAMDLINRYLQKYQNKHKIDFSTPLLVKN